MAYADRDTTGSRIIAAVVVVIILAVTGYAFVTGLAYQFVKKVKTDLTTVDVAPPPPPPPPEVPPPPPPPNQVLPPPPVVTPPPIVQTVTPPVQVYTVPVAPPQVYAPPAPPMPPPPPAPPHVSQAAGLKGNVSQYFSTDNYPPAAIRANAQGRVVARLAVGADGRVTDCTVTSGSGNEDLDSTTCRIARSRIRFTPAKDDSGNAIASSFTLPVRWVLPKDE